MERRSQANPKPQAIREVTEKKELLDEVQTALWDAVAHARSVGCSWAEIGQVFGVSKQSAQERFSKEPRR